MNDQRFNLYFKLGSVVLGLSVLVVILQVVEQRTLAEANRQMNEQFQQLNRELPLLDQVLREMVQAAGPDPRVAPILRQNRIVAELPLPVSPPNQPPNADTSELNPIPAAP